MAAKRSASSKAKSSKKHVKLVLSTDKNPTVALKAGMRLDVVGVTLLDTKLRKAKAGAARLCGGSNTCLALVEV